MKHMLVKFWTKSYSHITIRNCELFDKKKKKKKGFLKPFLTKR